MAWGASLVWETGFVPPPFYTDHRDGFWLESADSFGCLPLKSSFSGGDLRGTGFSFPLLLPVLRL